ncbi:MAG: FAD:protein FMN transferase [Spirochaetes bacterium]|nr:FAD:protein FMN transferase [Spirochaetota bacterium]
MTITISVESRDTAMNAANAAFDEIARIERLMSPVVVTSDVCRINALADRQSVEVSEETFKILEYAKEVWRKSEGAFDITFASVAHLWHFDPKNFSPPSNHRVRSFLHLVNSENLLLDRARKAVRFRKKNMKIGLGGIAKGLAILRAIETLQRHGIRNAIVEAGGDLMVIGTKGNERWRVGLVHPRKKEILAVIEMFPGKAVATSGDYERFSMYRGIRYHHILDPSTGFPARNCISVSVICDDPIKADAYATACFVLGKEKAFALAKKDNFSLIVIDTNMQMYVSETLQGKINLIGNIPLQWVR